MQTRHILSMLLVLLLSTIGVKAQTNTLSTPDVSLGAGKEIPFRVNLDNTADIVAVQFTITLPEGIWLYPDNAETTERTANHTLAMRDIGDRRYKTVIMANDNSPISGRTGAIMTVPLYADNEAEDGAVFQPVLSDVAIVTRDGSNLATGFSSGTVTIAPGADLVASEVRTDAQEIIPGEKITVNWKIENIGAISTTEGWSEQISLVSDNETQTSLIATTYYDGILSEGGIISRQAEISVPLLLGLDGTCRVQVRIIPYSNSSEPVSAQGNNTQISENTLSVGKLLSLEISPNRIDENDDSRIALNVNRSGSWSTEETFDISASPSSRISIPKTITIPIDHSGAVVYLTVNDNDVTDNDSIVNISVMGRDYPEASVPLYIDDDERPSLTITTSNEDVNEGENFQLTVSSSRKCNDPLTVTLTCENARRFSFPQQVIIPAGEQAVSVDVTAVDNDEIELEETLAFRASSNNYDYGECLVTIYDNDMPSLIFTLSPENVSEADGYSALFGVIKRTDNLDKRITIKLFDDAEGLLEYSTTTITMEKNQSEVQFNIGVVDNDIVDGDKEVTVTAAVYVSSCNCSAPSDTKGVTSATVTIIDNDGPTLKIKPEGTAMLEGSEDNVFIISHNIQLDKDLTVNVSSDKDDILEYAHELTIPAGNSASELLVKVKDNDQQDDSCIVTFKVEADGYAMGSCWLLITDQSLPDAVVSLYADKAEVEAEQALVLKAVVKNVGNSILKSGIPVEIAFSGSKEKINFATEKPIEAGDSIVFECAYNLPSLTGDYYFEASVNDDGKVQELIYANNSSPKVPVTLLVPFSATAYADKDVYRQGEEVTITGSVKGTAGKNANVEVYLLNDGSRQTLNAISDADGNYSVSWQPLSKQSGHFAIGACYPGSKLTDETDAFDVYGIKATDKFKTNELSLSETISGKITIVNPGNLEQTGLTVKPKGQSDNCEFTYNAPANISAGESVEIEYTIKGNGISNGTDWQQMPIEISTAEGSSLEYNIYYFVHPLKAMLETDKSAINTTMTFGTPRDYQVTIRNIGKTETGKITFALPDWIQTVTPREMSTLAQGESATVVLRFIPTGEMKLNVNVSGQIGINCANGDGACISFNLTPVSEEEGTLKVDVVDEYTYFTDEAPHVNNATVRIMDPASNKIVAEGITMGDGTFSAKLPEGYYTVTVDADKHSSYSNTVIVDPGVEKAEEVFLSYEAITYSWDVVETEVEDEYEIETIVKYETRVPKPVVVISLPEERPDPYSIIPVTVTNHGLVNALNLDLSLSISNGYRFEFLNETSLDILPPQQSYVLYAKMVPSDSEDTENKVVHKAGSSAESCLYLIAKAPYNDPCEKNPNKETSYAEKRWGKCNDTSGNGGSGGGYGGDHNGPGYPSLWSNTTHESSESHDNVSAPTKDCNGKPIGNNPDDNNPSEPIRLPIVPDGPLSEQPCDSKEEPKLVYKLIPVNGTRYEVKGVAADGVSQVKIVPDSASSRLPAEDCENITNIHWELSRNLGKIEGTSLREAIFTAPDRFPNNRDSVITIDATVYYTQRTEQNVTWGRQASVSIEIIRPPVVFVHGLGDSHKCWKELDEMLVTYGLYKDSINFRTNYKNTNTEAFEVNVPVVGRSINDARNRALKHGYIASKCDIVGHSMGGILTRLYVQDHNGSDLVNRIITVNTPHSGSEIGDAVMGHKIIFGNLARAVYTVLNGQIKTDINAIRDLAVESEAINHLNYSSYVNRPQIPVHAIATQKNAIITEIAQNGLGPILSSLGGRLMTAGPVGIALNVAAKYLAHFVSDDWAQVGVGDLVVSTESQLGGCLKSTTIGDGLTNDGPWHVSSPNDSKVKEAVKDLLVDNDKKSEYSNGWFTPTPRTFDHAGWQLGIIGDMALDFVSPLNNLQYQNKFKKAADALKIDPYTESNLKAGEIAGNVLTGGAMALKVNDTYEKYSENPQPFRVSASNHNEHYLNIDLLQVDGFTKPLVVVMFDDDEVVFKEGYSTQCPIPSTFSGDAKILIYQYNEEDKLVYFEDYLYTIDHSDATPVSIHAEETFVNVGQSEALRLLCTWNDGSETFVDAENVTFVETGIASFYGGDIIGLQQGYTTAVITYAGLTCGTEVHVFSDDNGNNDSDDSNSICSTITLSFKQKSVMTRQAFRGTLTVNNGNDATPMTDVKLNLEVRDMNGNLTTSHEFQINPESLEGFKGELDTTSGWTLGSKETGTATILFIPTKYAAPTEPTDYSFGGTFSYTDPYTGLTVTRSLNPVTLTVKPSPNLNLTYFMQRDVFGDDPLTETVEPSKEAEFSLLIHNIGYGDASDVRMLTQQPQIIDNQKGLLIDFEMVSSQLNGGEKDLALGSAISTTFGDIKSMETAYAQWWFKSSLLGHFTDYDVKATHVTSYDNPDLSLLNEVSIHELIRSLETEKEGKRLAAFMTNDIPDANDTPDMIYLSDGTVENVHSMKSFEINKTGDNTYLLSVTPSTEGWNYGSVIDPTYGVSEIVSVVRQTDGKAISLRNFWQTDRTLRDGKDPLYENRIHFADNLASAENQEYVITFSPAPEITLEVVSIEGTPLSGQPAKTPIASLNVMFNKYVDDSSFTADDIEMAVQGEKIDASGIAISTEDNKTFTLNLSAVNNNAAPGFYTLTVNTESIVDEDGFTGKNGKTVSWNYYPDGSVSTLVSIYPENAGSVRRNSEEGDLDIMASTVINSNFGDQISLFATPAEGYEFKEWTSFNASYSSDTEITLIAISNNEIAAVFSPKSYSVDIDSFCEGGTITGSYSGIYTFGEEITLIAVPDDDYVFTDWVINGEKLKDEPTLCYTVKGSTTISAVFADKSGIDSATADHKIVIYSVDGLVISSDADAETIRSLAPGIYIVNGVKYIVR